MRKSTILSIPFMVLAVSCTNYLNPWDYDMNQNQDPNGYNNNYQNNINPPAETDPTHTSIQIEDESESEDNVTGTKFDATLNIRFTDSDVTVTGNASDVSYEKSGARITFTNNGDKKVNYILSGSSSDGCFKLYSSKKQAITLKDLTLTNTRGAAINNQSKKRTYIVIEGNNTICDGKVNSDGDYPEQTSDEDMKAAIFSEAQLAFSGTGALTVNAVGKAGITSDDYVRFLTGSNVTVTSAKGHGVRGKDAVIVTGGTVNVTLESGATGKKCFSTDSLVYIAGGNTTLVNKASAGMVDGELTGAAGIKADCDFVMKGGNLSVTASGKGCKCISGDKDGYFEGGTVIANASGANYGNSGNNGRYDDSDNSTSSKAIKFDGNLEFYGSAVSATSSAHEAIEAKGTLYISAGTVYAVSGDDAINSGSTMTISDGVVYAYSTGNDGLDANGHMIIKGGTIFAIGCGSPEVGVDANTEKGYSFFLQKGNLITIGGVESNSSVSQPVISTTWARQTVYSLCDGSTVLFSFKTPSSGGTGLYMSAPSLVSGSSYTLVKSPTITGSESYFDGIISIGGSVSGGTSSTLTATAYQSNGMGGGGGFGPGGIGW